MDIAFFGPTSCRLRNKPRVQDEQQIPIVHLPTLLVILGAHMTILFVVKEKILRAGKWPYKSPPPIIISTIVSRMVSTYVVQSPKTHMSIQRPLLDLHPIMHQLRPKQPNSSTFVIYHVTPTASTSNSHITYNFGLFDWTENRSHQVCDCEVLKTLISWFQRRMMIQRL